MVIEFQPKPHAQLSLKRSDRVALSMLLHAVLALLPAIFTAELTDE